MTLFGRCDVTNVTMGQSLTGSPWFTVPALLGKQRVYALCGFFLIIPLGGKSFHYLMEALTRGLERARVHTHLILMGALW